MCTRKQANIEQNLNDNSLVRPSPLRRMVAWLTLVAYIGQPMIVTAQVVADQAAAPTRRPVVDVTANGVPLIQIATPSAAGVSHNQYTQFNVDPAGVILNNSSTTVLTQQAGYVSGNQNLANGSARVILNEVTGTNRSQLNGYIEVAGQQAEVIVANPNGITCNGCGFINTSRGVLTTGTPVMGASGSLDSFRVTGGDIQIGTAGLNGNNLSQLDLIARSVQINGQLWGTNLNVITGANLVNYNTLGVQIIAGDANKPTVGIDVALLGGMYANKIRLIGTEAGVGVNSLGTLAAQAGDFTLDNQGQITLGGSTSASGNLTINSGTGISNTGTLTSQQAALLTSSGNITNTGSLSATGSLTINSNASLTNSGSLYSQQVAQFTGTSSITNSGSLYSLQDALLSSRGSITNTGLLSSQGNLTLKAGSLNSIGTLGAGIDVNGNATLVGNLIIATLNQTVASGTNTSGGTMSVTATDINLANSKTKATGDVTLISTAGNIALNSAQTQSVVGNIALTATGTVTNGFGTLYGLAVTSNSAGFSNIGGTVYGQNALTIQSSGGLVNQNGLMQTLGDLSIIVSAALNNQAGRIEANGAASAMTVTAGSIDNTLAGQIVNTGTGITTLNGGALIDSTGTIGGKGNLIIKAASVNNTQVSTAIGKIASGADLTLNVTGSLNNNSGQIYAFGNLNFNQPTATLDNTSGSISSSGGISTFNLSSVNNLRGKIAANGDISLIAGILSGDGQIVTNGNETISLQGDYTYMAGNLFAANGDLTLGVAGNFTNQGALQAQRNLTVSAANITNNTGASFNSTQTTLNATGTLPNTGFLLNNGTILNNGSINGNNIFTNSNTLINNNSIIGNYLTLTAYNLTNQSDTAIIAAPYNINLWVANQLSNLAGAEIYSVGDLNIGGNSSNTIPTQWLLNEGSSMNRSSLIQSDGNININAVNIDNRRPTIGVTTVTQPVVVKTLTTPLNYTLTIVDPITGAVTPAPPAPYTATDAPITQGYWATDMKGALNSAAQSFNLVGTEPFSGATAVHYQSISPAYTVIQYSGTAYDINGNLVTVTQLIKATDIASTTGGPGAYTVTLKVGGVLYFSSLDKQGAYYDVTYFPGFDPNVNTPTAQILTVPNPNTIVAETSRTLTTTVANQVLVQPAAVPNEARIVATGNININLGGTLNNYVSTIAAGNNITINGVTTGGIPAGAAVPTSATVQNTALTLTSTSTTTGTAYLSGAYSVCNGFFCFSSTTYYVNAQLPLSFTPSSTSTTPYASNITAGGSFKGIGVSVTNQSSATPNQITGTSLSPTTSAASPGAMPNITLPTSGLYTIHPQPSQNYLVVTNPIFTNYQNYISSDYMMSRLTLDPQITQKRLGDGFYEQQLINDQVTQLTGRRFIGPYANAQDEIKGLMDSGIASAKELKLVTGIALTPKQVAALTTDIVWLVEEKVSLPDGSSTKVLVPQVYLTAVHQADLKPNGALIAADVVDINVAGAPTPLVSVVDNAALKSLSNDALGSRPPVSIGSVYNSGTIRANSALNINAKDIVNQSGTIRSGGTTSLTASNDILNQSGNISGQKVALVAGHDILNTTATQVFSTGNASVGASKTLTGAIGSITATDSLSLNALNDISIMGSLVKAGGDASLYAGNKLTVGTIQTGSSAHSSVGFNYDTSTTTYLGSTITSGGKLDMSGKGDVTMTSAQLQSGGDTSIVSGGNLTINAAKNVSTEKYSAGGGGNYYASNKLDETVVGSSVNAGGNISLVAKQLSTDDSIGMLASPGNGSSGFDTRGFGRTDGKGNITLNSVAISSKSGNVTVAADANVSIGVTEEQHTASTDTRSESSGFLTTTHRTTHDETWRTDNVGSSLSGDNISITSGKNINVVGSSASAEHDIKVAAMGDVNITAATNTYGSDSYSRERTTGLQIKDAFNISDAGPEIISKAHTDGSKQSLSRSSFTSNSGNLSILAGGNIVGQGADLAAKTGEVSLKAVGGSVVLYAGQDTFNQSSSTQVITSPNAFTKQRHTITDTYASLDYLGSTVQGKSVKINSGGDIVLQATDVKAGEGGIALDAGGDIKLLAAANSTSRTHTETLSTDGFIFRADGSLNDTDTRRMNNKHENQTVINQVTSLVSGGNISTHSGGDTLIQASTLDAQGSIDLQAIGYAGGTNADGTKYEGRKGTITFAAIKDSNYVNNVDSSNSMPWQSSSGHGQLVETVKLANIKAGKGLNVDAKGGIVVDIPEVPAEAPAPVQPVAEEPIPTNGPDGKPLTEAQKTAIVAERAAKAAERAAQAEVARKAHEEQRFNDHIQNLANQPGQEWIGQLAKMAKDKPDSVKLQQVNAALEHWDYSHDGLTPTAMAVIAIVVTYFTAGAGSGVVGATATGATATTAGVVTAAVVQAAVTTLAIQATTSLINNKGNVGKTLNDMGQSQNVKALVTAMITAGVLSGLSQTITLGDGNTSLNSINAKSDFTLQLEKNVINNATGAVINHAMYGGDLQQQLEQSLKNSLIDAGAAKSANWIGDMKADKTFNDLTHKLAHAIAGCAIGAAKSNDCSSGALGAVVGEISAELYGGNRSNGGIDQPGFKTDTVNFAKMMAGVAAAITGGDVNVAAGTAGNAAENNRLLHLDESKVLAKAEQNKTDEENHRLQAAACAMVQCSAGVPTSDPKYQELLSLEQEGSAYFTEQMKLTQSGLFKYSTGITGDAGMDWRTRNDQAFTRVEGLTNGVSGTVGAVLSVAGGVALCTTGVLCAAGASLATVGGTLSYGASVDGYHQLTGSYNSPYGQNVLDSFDPLTNTSLGNPLYKDGMSVVVAGLTVASMGGFRPSGGGSVGANASTDVGETAGTIRNVNPTSGDLNCVNCVVATDATLRGNPASALPGGPYTLPVLEQQFGSKFSPATLTDIESNLLQQGNGATGVVFGYPPTGSNIGHVFNVVNQNGVIRYLDGQTGTAANASAFPRFQFMPLPKIGE